jgi:hypothetical protein
MQSPKIRRNEQLAVDESSIMALVRHQIGHGEEAEPSHWPSHLIHVLDARMSSILRAASTNRACRPSGEPPKLASLTTCFVRPSSDALTPTVGVSNAQKNARPSNAVKSTWSNACRISTTFSFATVPDFVV